MHRLLLYAFLFLSFPVFSQDSIVNIDTSPVKGSVRHEIGVEHYPTPQKTLETTLLKGMFSVNIPNYVIVLAAVVLLALLILVIVLVRRRKRLKKRGQFPARDLFP